MASNGRLKNGRFATGNTFARSHGAPLGNQNARGHGAPARNINAVKTGEFMTFEQYETPYDRLRGGETELKTFSVNAGHLLMRVRREMTEEKATAKSGLSYSQRKHIKVVFLQFPTREHVSYSFAKRQRSISSPKGRRRYKGE